MARRATHRDRPVWLSLRIMAWRLRNILLLGGLAVAGVLVVRTLAPPDEPTVDVVVTARAVDAGTELGSADLRLVGFPPSRVPDGARAATADLTGRAVTVDLPRGLPVVDELLEGQRFQLDAPHGTVVVPVRLTDAAVGGLLRPGDRIDLVSQADPYAADAMGLGTAAGPAVLAHRALVLDVASTPAAQGRGIDLGTDTAAVTVVAVSPDEGRLLAAAGAGAPLGAVLVE